MMANEPLRTLVLRAKSGDPDALTAVIDRFRPLIQKYVRQAAPEDAHDVEQELVMRLILLIRAYREELPNGFLDLVELEWQKHQGMGREHS